MTTILYLNIRSLIMNGLCGLRQLATNYQPDLIIISETWLWKNHGLLENYSLVGYRAVFNCSSPESRSGGTAIYSKVEYRIIENRKNDPFNRIVLSIADLTVVTFYRPTSYQHVDGVAEILDGLGAYQNLIAIGDMNVDMTVANVRRKTYTEYINLFGFRAINDTSVTGVANLKSVADKRTKKLSQRAIDHILIKEEEFSGDEWEQYFGFKWLSNDSSDDILCILKIQTSDDEDTRHEDIEPCVADMADLDMVVAATTLVAAVPKGRKSPYWKYFGYATSHGIVNSNILVCVLCGRKLKNNGNTTVMKKHIKTLHEDEYALLPQRGIKID